SWRWSCGFSFFIETATADLYPLSLHDALPILASVRLCRRPRPPGIRLGALLVLQLAAAVLLWLTLFPPPQAVPAGTLLVAGAGRSEEHTSELQSRENLVCRLLLEKKKNAENR